MVDTILPSPDKPKKKPKSKAKIGRPTKATPQALSKAITLAKEGKAIPEIAEALNIDYTTVTEWNKVNKPFSLALKGSRAKVDQKVAHKLLERAMGYETQEHSIEEITANGQTAIRKKVIKKQVPPDVTAQIFWLKNRQPDEWQDRRIWTNTEANGGMSFAEWAKHQEEKNAKEKDKTKG